MTQSSDPAVSDLHPRFKVDRVKQGFYLFNMVLAAVFQIWALLHLPYFGLSSLDFDHLLSVFFLLQALMLPVLGWLTLDNVAGQTGSQKFHMLKLLDLSRFRLVAERVFPDVPLFLMPLIIAPALLYSVFTGFPGFFWGWLMLYVSLIVAVLQVSLLALIIGLIIPGRAAARIVLLTLLLPGFAFLFPTAISPGTEREIPRSQLPGYLLTYPSFLAYARGTEPPIPPVRRDKDSFPAAPDAAVFPPEYFELLIDGLPKTESGSKAVAPDWMRDTWTPAHAERMLPALHFKLSGLLAMLLFLVCAKLIDRL